MEFYHDLVTQKSWQLLQGLRQKYHFILIGGWAVFLYTKALKSKDIDLILDYQELVRLKEAFSVSKNERLKKYEIKTEGVDIDIYLPFYSDLGLPVEEVEKYLTSLEGFTIPVPEVLALLKMKALTERKGSVKGRKDLIDLLSLFQVQGFDFERLKEIAGRYNLENLLTVTAEEMKNVFQIEEMDLNSHRLSRLKKQVLPQLKIV